MGTLICWTPLNFNESLVFIYITFCLMFIICLSSTTDPSFMNMQIDRRDWMTTDPSFWLWTR